VTSIAPTARPESSHEDSFPRVFWTANVTELFERAAYYSMASFVVIYLGQLGLGSYWPSTLNGLLWCLVYFLPILSGTIADQIGFRRALLGAFVLLVCGYFCMGYPVWVGGVSLSATPSEKVTAGSEVVVPVALAILLIGLGGSVVKPCISGTVQKTAGARATLAFAIFYMVINIGSLVGRGAGFTVRKATAANPEAAGYALSTIFFVALACSVIAFFVVMGTYRDHEKAPAGAASEKPRKSVREILLGMVMVLGNVRFVLFLLVSSGFNFLYTQVYNVLPLYTRKVVEAGAPMDLYTAANPLVIVCFQLLITRCFGKMKPIRSIIVGTVIISLSMGLNLIPLYMAGGVRAMSMNLLPIGSLYIVLTVALIALGELFTSARTFEWIGAMAPKGQEGLFLGYANLPMAIGSLVGGPAGAWIFNEVMCRGAVKENGMFLLNPESATKGWLILTSIGFLSAASMWLFNTWLERQVARDAQTASGNAH